MPAIAAELHLRQHVSVLPQVVLQSEVLGLTGDEVEARVREELDRNPALELDERQARRQVRQAGDRAQLSAFGQSPASASLPSYSALPTLGADADLGDRLAWTAGRSLTHKHSLRDDLLAQLNLQPHRDYHNLAAYLIHNIAPTGYLEASVEEVARELEVAQEDVQRALRIVQGLAPTGVGARDLRECLLLQLRACDPGLVPPGAEIFIKEHLHAAMGGREKAARTARLGLEHVDAILVFMRRYLSPYPGLAYHGDGEDGGAVRPDVVLRWHENPHTRQRTVQVEVPESAAHGLRVSSAYAALDARVRGGGVRRSGVRGTLELVREARQFIANLQRRYEVLRVVGEAIAAAQAEFIQRGPEYLRPLDKKAIAAQVRLHESTVCRATRGKFVQLPDGIVVSFDVFFDDALPLKCLVKYIIQREDKAQPVSDDEIATRLRAAGHVIARRTVAKYRAEMGIRSRGERRRPPHPPGPPLPHGDASRLFVREEGGETARGGMSALSM